MIRTRFAAVGIALAIAFVAASACAQCIPDVPYRQSDDAKRRYADPPFVFQTPAFTAGKTGFTSHAELVDFLKILEGRAGNAYMRVAGHSQEGRVVAALVFSASRRYSPAALREGGKPLVFLLGGVHGNEPAAGEAMLAVAHALALGELAPLLERISVVMVPRANPDGAGYFWRGTASCMDVDRDQLKVDLPETMALRRLVNEFEPDVIVDGHEFGAAHAYDFTIAAATHPNVAGALTRVAQSLVIPAVLREIERAGYSQFPYPASGDDAAEPAAGARTGAEADVGRNYSGLRNALSFVIASRGVGIARESFVRRVHTQYVALSALLTAVAGNAAAVRGAVRAAREETVHRGGQPAADDKVVVAPAIARTRAYAYLVLPPYTEVVRRLTYSGLEIRRLREPVELDVESYEVIERRAGAAFMEGHLRSTVKTRVTTRKRLFPAGTYVFPMAQPGAHIAIAALEPESPAGFVSLGIVPTDPPAAAREGAPSEVPIFRLKRSVPLDAQPFP